MTKGTPVIMQVFQESLELKYALETIDWDNLVTSGNGKEENESSKILKKLVENMSIQNMQQTSNKQTTSQLNRLEYNMKVVTEVVKK